MGGREDSVKDIFDRNFRSACNHFDVIDIKASLNGLDRQFNADNLYSTFDRFFIVEFKSYRGDIKTEGRKPSACKLCCGLAYSPMIIPLHDYCHLIMWGIKKQGELEADFDIYRNSVCNTNVLPNCTGSQNMQLNRNSYSGKSLAFKAANNMIGLNANDFKTYLIWLLGNRGGGGGEHNKNKELNKEGGDFLSTIYATSDSYAIDVTFDSIDSLHRWAIGDRPHKRNDDWGGFKF